MDKELINSIRQKLTCPLVVLDCETTHEDPNTTEVVQFCAIKIWPSKDKVDELYFLIKPKTSVTPGAEEVHGISNEQLEKEKPFSDYAGKIKDLFDGEVCVAGYNIVGFDLTILARQLEESGFPGVLDHVHILDAFTIFKEHNGRKLADAVKFYTNQEAKDSHDALGDVLSTVAVIDKQLDIEKGTVDDVSKKFFEPPDQRIGFSGHIVFDKEKNEFVINFGKHKGTKVRDLENGYKRWIIQSDFPVAVKKFLSNR